MLLAVVGLRLGTAMHWIGSDPATAGGIFPASYFLFFSR